MTVGQAQQPQQEFLELPRLRLTRRELEVLFWLVSEADNNQIARLLTIEADTVRKHINSAMQKLGVSTKTGLIIWYCRSFGFPPYSSPKYS